MRRDPRSKVAASLRSRAASRDEGDRLNSSRTKVGFLREESEEKQEQDWALAKTVFQDANNAAQILEQRGRPRRPGLDFRKITEYLFLGPVYDFQADPRRQRVQTRRHRLEKLADVKRPRCLGNSKVDSSSGVAVLAGPAVGPCEKTAGGGFAASSHIQPTRRAAPCLRNTRSCDDYSGGGLAGPAFFLGKGCILTSFSHLSTLVGDLDLAGFGFSDRIGTF
ncbi:hypothetical protein BDZ89DRAFT_1118596 [Hymenopellis radicata]|nr:hypothetical protein BDZ89DRAFT_1118596 [Hymenopellis radicata]